MSCKVTLQNTPCAKSVGGIKKVWWEFRDEIVVAFDFNDINSNSDNFDYNTITKLILKRDAFFKELVTKTDVVTITENISDDSSIGNETRNIEIIIKQSDMLSEAVSTIKNSANSEYVFMFEDMQGRYFIYGLDKPVKLSSTNIESGNVIADFNGGTFTFTTEGVLSRFWTKYEAEIGDFSSNYIKVKELLQPSQLNEIQIESISLDTGQDIHVVVNQTSEHIEIILNFRDINQQPLHVDEFYFSKGDKYVRFDNDVMGKVVRYYLNKKIQFNDKKDFTIIVDNSGSEDVGEITVKFFDGYESWDLVLIEGLPYSEMFIIEGEVDFGRSIYQDEDILRIKRIQYI